ncbi:MAG: hypothetical protein ACI8RH_001194, partial [Flavobacteriales bacterium]
GKIAKVECQLRHDKMYLIRSRVFYNVRGQCIGKVLVQNV